MKRFLLFIIGSIFSLTLLGAMAVAVLFSYFAHDLPDYQQLENYDPAVVTRLYARDGQLFHEYAQEKRVFLPISSIPQHIINTFLAAEDKNFYHHQGVDVPSIIRAFVTNIQNIAQGRRPSGASTITQQVAKNFFLTNEVSIARKIKEAILAFRLEKAFTKEKILELYLNEIYLGGGAYGVAAAALHYFNKSLDELTIAEAAYLAGLPKAPNTYNPVSNKEKALVRRNWVIQRMVETGCITPEEGVSAQSDPLTPNFHNPENTVEADFFSEEVRRDLVARFGVNELYKGGLTVKTTLDPGLQKIADEVLREGLVTYDRRYGWRGALFHFEDIPNLESFKTYKDPAGLDPYKIALVHEITKDKASLLLKDGSKGFIALKEVQWAALHKVSKEGRPYTAPKPKSMSEVLKPGDVVAVEKIDGENYALRQIPEVSGAIVVMDPHTGRVLAMSGGYSFDMSEFNRATQALRQPGSAFKVFAYLTALEKNLTPATHILDAPVEIDIGWGLGKWRPINISEKFYGEVTLRRAFESSYNASTVQLAKALGIKDIIATAKRLGVYDSLPEQWAMVLGAGETTLLRMTTAFAIIANGGKKIAPIFIDRIQDRRGKTVFKSDARACGACSIGSQNTPPLLDDVRETLADPANVYQLITMMEGVVERGTGKNAKVPNHPMAGKSGTSSEYRDALFIGFNPNLVVGVYIGFDAPKSLGRLETGGKIAAPIFSKFMKRALEKTPPVPFKAPPGLKFKRINLTTGMIAQPGDKSVILEGFKPNTEPQEGEIPFVIGRDAGLPNNAVIATDNTTTDSIPSEIGAEEKAAKINTGHELSQDLGDESPFEIPTPSEPTQPSALPTSAVPPALPTPPTGATPEAPLPSGTGGMF